MIFEPIYKGFLDGVVSGVVGVATPGLLTGSLRLAGLLRGRPRGWGRGRGRPLRGRAKHYFKDLNFQSEKKST